MWRCTTWIWTLVRVIYCPSQPSTGHLMDPEDLGNYTLYSLGSGVAGGVAHWVTAPSHAGPSDGLPDTPSPTQSCTPNTELSPAASPKRKVHSCHLLRICHLRVYTNNVARLTHHPNCFVGVVLEDHPLKKNVKTSKVAWILAVLGKTRRQSLENQKSARH